jgi:hypothetical protein
MIPPSLAQKTHAAKQLQTSRSSRSSAQLPNSRAEFGFGIIAATIEVIFRVNAGFFEYTAVQSNSVSMRQTCPPGFTTRFIS